VLVGDVMCLEAGDVIPVDGVLVAGYNVTCDESTASGESDTLRKVPGEEALDAVDPAIKFDRKFDPFILSGSKVLEGVGTFIVTAVGPNSYYGRTLKCKCPWKRR
jgi:P-type Ca2+ transporter type 2C